MTIDPREPDTTDDVFGVVPTSDFGRDFPGPTHLPTEEEESGIYEEAPKVKRVRGRRPKDPDAPSRAKDNAAAPLRSVVGTPPKPVPLGVVAVVPAMTNFDFLEGSYNKVRQSRLILELVAGAVGVIMILVVALGLDAGIQTTAANSSVQTLKGIVKADNAKYSTATGLGNITGAALSTDLAARTAALQAAVDSTTNIANVIQQFYALSANGITISSINIAPAPPAAVVTTTTLAGATTTVPPATTTTIAPPASSAPMNITVVATVKNYDAYTTLATEVKNLGPYITNVSTVPSGGVPAITVTITASIMGLPAQTPSSFTSLGGKLH